MISSGFALITQPLKIVLRDFFLLLVLPFLSFDHEKEYEVTVGKPILDKALKRMAAGVTIMGSKTRPAKIKRLSGKKFLITLKEGRNRQIRKMVRKVGNHVTELKRVRISKVKLGRLGEGSWRYLTEKEKNDLLNPKK